MSRIKIGRSSSIRLLECRHGYNLSFKQIVCLFACPPAQILFTFSHPTAYRMKKKRNIYHRLKNLNWKQTPSIARFIRLCIIFGRTRAIWFSWIFKTNKYLFIERDGISRNRLIPCRFIQELEYWSLCTDYTVLIYKCLCHRMAIFHRINRAFRSSLRQNKYVFASTNTVEIRAKLCDFIVHLSADYIM